MSRWTISSHTTRLWRGVERSTERVFSNLGRRGEKVAQSLRGGAGRGGGGGGDEEDEETRKIARTTRTTTRTTFVLHRAFTSPYRRTKRLDR